MILTCFLLALSGLFKAVSDILQHKYKNSLFVRFNPYFFDPNLSWKNKYKDKDPKNGANFLGSTTVFVFLTDAWHLSNFIKLSCFQLAIAINFADNLLNIFIYFLVFKIVHNVVFELFYSKILVKKTSKIKQTK